MLRSDVDLISVDDHVIEHADVWQDRLPGRLKPRGPRVEERDGIPAVSYTHLTLPTIYSV